MTVAWVIVVLTVNRDHVNVRRRGQLSSVQLNGHDVIAGELVAAVTEVFVKGFAIDSQSRMSAASH